MMILITLSNLDFALSASGDACFICILNDIPWWLWGLLALSAVGALVGAVIAGPGLLAVGVGAFLGGGLVWGLGSLAFWLNETLTNPYGQDSFDAAVQFFQEVFTESHPASPPVDPPGTGGSGEESDRRTIDRYRQRYEKYYHETQKN